jgi:hypothetical protein
VETGGGQRADGTDAMRVAVWYFCVVYLIHLRFLLLLKTATKVVKRSE